MAFGAVQLGILSFIRKQTAEHGRVEFALVRDWAFRTLKIRTKDQASITIQRLVLSGHIENLPVQNVAYVLSEKNEKEYEDSVRLFKTVAELIS